MSYAAAAVHDIPKSAHGLPHCTARPILTPLFGLLGEVRCDKVGREEALAAVVGAQPPVGVAVLRHHNCHREGERVSRTPNRFPRESRSIGQ